MTQTSTSIMKRNSVDFASLIRFKKDPGQSLDFFKVQTFKFVCEICIFRRDEFQRNKHANVNKLVTSVTTNEVRNAQELITVNEVKTT